MRPMNRHLIIKLEFDGNCWQAYRKMTGWFLGILPCMTRWDYIGGTGDETHDGCMVKLQAYLDAKRAEKTFKVTI